jgi:SAM-dependent methyltransferase
MSSLRARIAAWLHPPLESFPDAPENMLSYRHLLANPDLKREPGGWRYKERFYPDYLTVGGASHAIFREALKYCKGKGVDIGAGHWPLPGSVPLDLKRGPGRKQSIRDFDDGSLDYVFSSHCLEHIAAWQEELAVWIAKLKPGGALFLYLPHPDCGIWSPGAPMVGAGHVWAPSLEVLRTELQARGMTLIASDAGPDAMQSFFACARK